MTATDRERVQLHRHLDQVLGEEDASTLMRHLPPAGWSDLATNTELGRVETTLRAEITRVETTLRAEITRLDGRIDRVELRLGQLEQRMDRLEQRMDRLEGRMGALETRVAALPRTLFLQMAALNAATVGVVLVTVNLG